MHEVNKWHSINIHEMTFTRPTDFIECLARSWRVATSWGHRALCVGLCEMLRLSMGRTKKLQLLGTSLLTPYQDFDPGPQGSTPTPLIYDKIHVGYLLEMQPSAVEMIQCNKYNS